MTSRRVATVKSIALLTVAAATHNIWVTAISLYWAARTLGPVIETICLHQQAETTIETVRPAGTEAEKEERTQL